MALDMTDPRLLAYLEGAAAIAATQDLTEDRRSQTILLSAVFLCLAVFFVLLRFYARYKQMNGYGIDDWLILVSLLFLGGNMATVTAMVKHGHLGLHSGALTIGQAIYLGKVLLVAESLYLTNVNLIKLSLLAMYYRIFPIRSMRIGCYILGAISMAWNIALLGVAEGQCIPMKKNWLPWVAGRCINMRVTFLAVSIPNILTDVAILALPLPHVWRLQTNLKQKLSLSVIFLLGSFVVFASIYRFTVYLNYDPNDMPYTLATGAAWNMVEMSSGIVSACMPALGPLVRGCIGRISGSSKNGLSTGNTNPNLVTIGGGKGKSGSSAHHKHNPNSQSFHKLDDEVNYGNSEVDLVGGERERRKYEGNITVTATVTQNCQSEAGSDEIPLTTIRNPKDVDWSQPWTRNQDQPVAHGRTLAEKNMI